MGFIKTIKELINLKKELKEIDKDIEEFENNKDKYLAMSADELCALPDDMFIEVAHFRIFNKQEKQGTEALTSDERGYYISTSFAYDVCFSTAEALVEYFISEDREYEELLGALEIIGADDYRNLVRQFISVNNLNLHEFKYMNPKQLKKMLNKSRAMSPDEFEKLYDKLNEVKSLEEIADKFLLDNKDRMTF